MKKAAVILLPFLILALFLSPVTAESLTGSIVTFGRWENQPLTWEILSVNGNRVLLYLEHSLPSQPYNAENKAVTWQTCTLRAWLQDTFFQNAFSPAEASAIVNITNENPTTYGTDGGSETVDTVFLLSRSEFEAFFPFLSDRKTTLILAPEPGAKVGTVAFVSEYDQASPYWLRSPGVDEKHAACVSWSGIIESHSVKAGDIAVRPAIWVDLSVSDIR